MDKVSKRGKAGQRNKKKKMLKVVTFEKKVEQKNKGSCLLRLLMLKLLVDLAMRVISLNCACTWRRL